MQDIFERLNNEEPGISDELMEEIKQNKEVIEQIDRKFEQLNADLHTNDVVQLYILFQKFPIEGHEISKMILSRLYEFYLQNVAHLIANDVYALHLLLDLFSVNAWIFEIHSNPNHFASITYPLLESVTEFDPGSDRDLSVDLYMRLLVFCDSFNNGAYLLDKFINEHPDSAYVSDINDWRSY